jgi:hypothetical protein
MMKGAKAIESDNIDADEAIRSTEEAAKKQAPKTAVPAPKTAAPAPKTAAPAKHQSLVQSTATDIPLDQGDTETRRDTTYTR